MLDYYDSFIVLAQPLFLNATVNERELLKITCLIRNIPDTSTFEVLDPNGRPVNTVLGVFTVNNVNRTHAGTYTCIVRSALDGSNVTATSTVVVQCKLTMSAWYFFSFFCI